MRLILSAAASTLLVGLVGCGGSGLAPTAPASPSPDSGSTATRFPGTALGGVATRGDLSEQATAIYTVQIDPATLDATLTPKAVREGQANDDVTDLDVSCFLSGASVKLVGVTRGAGTIDVIYAFQHPFPNTAPHTLGAPVRALVMVDAEPGAPTFFVGDGDIVVNTGLVANASGYLDPGALLDTSGFTANAFPYQVLVDELLDNRDVTNGGSVTGNWTAPTGWQTGLPGTWTGFGWVHKGQRVTRTLSLNTAALAGGVSFDLAFIAKYAKPNRAGTTKSPSAPANTLDFAYRAYHGALDCEDVQFTYETGGFITNTASASTIYFKVRDWDARATESTQADLKDEVDASLVAVGESGPPTVELSIPDVLGTTVVPMTTILDDDTLLNPPDGDFDPDDGLAGDELFFCQSVIRGNGSVGAGDTTGNKLGLVRVTDPEESIDTSLWHFAIDCNTLGVIAGPPSITYQVFTVFQAPDNAAPTATVAVTTATVPSGGAAAIAVTNIDDLDGDPVTISIDWDDDATDDFTSGPIAVPTAGPLNYDSFANGAITFTHVPPAPDYRNLSVSISDGTDTVDITPAVGGSGEHFEVLAPSGCPNPPKTGTDVATGWTETLSVLFTTGIGLPSGSPQGPQDLAAFRSAPYLGQFVFQVNGASEHDFWRIADTNPPGTVTALTTGSLGGFMAALQAYQVEVDVTNRVLFTTRTGALNIVTPTTLYGTGSGGALADIRWFDYAGTPVNALGGTISTAGARPVAITLADNGDVFAIDVAHLLHRYVKASAYAEAPGFPINLLPLIGDPNNAVLADRWRVHDFVQNWHNQSFYILTGAGVSTGNNGRLHRIACDGTEAVGSPVAFTLNSGGHGRFADLAIDQVNAAGVPINEADVQLVTYSLHGTAATADQRIWNSNLLITSSTDVGVSTSTDYRCPLTFSTNNVMLSRRNLSGSYDHSWYLTPPAGWL